MAEKNTGKKIYINYAAHPWSEKAAADEAEVQGTSSSSILVDALSNRYVSSNDAEWFANIIYEKGIDVGMAAFYGQLAAGVNWKSTHDNAFPLVLLTQKYMIGAKMNIDDEKEYINNCLDSLKIRINKIGNADEINANDIKVSIKTLELILSKQDAEIDFRGIIETLIDFWEYINDWTITYRLLSAIHRAIAINEDAGKRLEVIKTVNMITSEW